ncbi:hypothetical protein AB0F17_32990 [Nonomuraea sp. NPDC026600]|uniref:hypothetical protein n=1 Tax=Nonomuraea sp. NPDC026600 TaxID=3155363 RepID=UPI00340210C1
MPDEIFGIPNVLTESETKDLLHVLSELWSLTYGESAASFDADLTKLRELFDPVARGHRLRERLANIPLTPPGVRRIADRYGPPVFVDVGDNRRIVGLEARILLEIFSAKTFEQGYVVLDAQTILEAERRALAAYRRWSLQRLTQVIALRAGHGAEVLQAISVGVVLVILVNRSTAPERAMVRLHDEASGEQVNDALFRSASEFAESIATGRGRSKAELRLRSGYQLTEASRRLAHRLAIDKKARADGDLVYVPENYRHEVVDFLAKDLARRTSLTEEALGKGFDRLVQAFHAEAGKLANRSMVFERSGDTAVLRRDLLNAFSETRSRSRSA